MAWTSESSLEQPWSEFADNCTIWDDNTTFWDVSDNVILTYWDVAPFASSWSVSSSTDNSWVIEDAV